MAAFLLELPEKFKLGRGISFALLRGESLAKL